VCCNQLCGTHGAALATPTGTIELAFCHVCGHIFNREFDPRLLEYTVGYENSLHGSERFREYADALADELVERYQLHGRTIVEIGCGRGEFLRALCQRGDNRGFGFDPSYPGDEQRPDSAGKISIRREIYRGGSAVPSPDFICSRHTLEHVGVPRDFLEGISSGSGRSGIPVFFEVPNSLYTVRDGGIWDIIYEHCSYFSPSSLARLFSDTGYQVLEVTEIFGGQFLTLHARTGAADHEGVPASSTELERIVSLFAETYHRKIEQWRHRLDDFARERRAVAVWGAGSKGTTFLNLLRPRNIEYIVDVNPLKHGKFVAGTGQEIVPPEFLKRVQPDVVVCMNPNYSEEIAQQLQSLGVRAELVHA
jgi:cyclopropane fatty-acyl-phospholipid synthase-like methyltransferase